MKSASFFTGLLLSAIFSGAFSATVSRRSCPEASRFGNPTITPQGAFAPGDVSDNQALPGSFEFENTSSATSQAINISIDLTCAVENFGIVPQFIDYTLEVPSSENNGHEQPIVLARHSIPTGSLFDTVSAHVGFPSITVF